jgi:hypothetical protein
MRLSLRHALFAIAVGMSPLASARAASSICSIDYDATRGEIHIDPISNGQVQIKIPLALHPVSSGEYSMTVNGDSAIWIFPKEFRIAPGLGHVDVFAGSPETKMPVTQSAPADTAPTEKLNSKFSPILSNQDTTFAKVNANGIREADSPDSDPASPTASAPPTKPKNAEIAKNAELQKELKGLNLDRSIPESPAFTALGISPETVTRPASVREFGTALLNGVDKSGKLQSGLAIDFAPYQILAGSQTTWPEYKHNLLTRILYNTQLSLGTTKATTDDKALRLAGGLNITLWDNGDPRLNDKIADLYRNDFVTHPPPSINPFQTDAEVHAAMDAYMESSAADEKQLQAQLAQIRKQTWAKSSWTVAAAPTWITPDGNAQNLKWDGVTVWSAFAYGFEGNGALENKAQLIVNARYRNYEMTPEPLAPKTFFRQDTLTIGGRLRFGSPDFNASIEGAFIQTWSDAHGSNSAYRLGANLERKIAENLWLTLALGQDFGTETTSKQLFVVSGLRLGTADKPQSPAVK